MNKYPSYDANMVALRRIEGQVRGLQRMIEDRQYCVDILTQIHAVIAALARVEDKVLEAHFAHCVTKAVNGSSASDKKKKLDEILKLIHRFRKI
ncbi:MAG: metal-sensitive transcriptional regulator [Candidatus Omnitrophota bacterium]